MKIVHICLACFFPDGFSYQENMLPKFHKQLGYDVEVIASLYTFDKNGNGTEYKKAESYINEYKIPVTRLDYKKPKNINRFFKRFIGLKKALSISKPDIIFIHGCQFLDIGIIVSYAKSNDVKIYVDNHADFSNSAKNFLSKNILHKIIWRRCAKKIEPFTKKFYGVMPARVDFLKEVYRLPEEKCELLVMGADDDLVKSASLPQVREKIRKQYGIKDSDFLIMTGGKIDAYKTQTLLLMQAVKEIKNENVKLIVFGSVTEELTEKLKSLCDGKRIMYIGWIESKDSYKYFASSDLVVFPGRHSVFWEQVAAQGIPMLVKDWQGTHHIDLGGNVRFLQTDSVTEIKKEILDITENKEKYDLMKSVAVNKGMKIFSYKDISMRSIEI
ncbi:MAG: glycosyltransferase [bacterium]|nr:glycosyltransferase [bacterium]